LSKEKIFDGSFYDADYFERGRVTGKGWLMNYHWMPRRTFKEAFGFIDTLELNESHYVLDFGCAKGFMVRALRELEIMADGCDISEYALSFAPKGCWNCSDKNEWENRKYTHVLVKDVFEHLYPNQLTETLEKISGISSKIITAFLLFFCCKDIFFNTCFIITLELYFITTAGYEENKLLKKRNHLDCLFIGTCIQFIRLLFH